MSQQKKPVVFIIASILMMPFVQPVANEAQGLTPSKKASLVHMVKQDCGSCHGMTLKGGLGPALLSENLKDKPQLFIQNTILYGRPGTAMPPWKSLLTVEEAKWITEQLQKGTLDEQ